VTVDALDGNAIGGLLVELFGAELTAARSVCGACGTAAPVAELAVYVRGPGTVVRCRACGAVLMVVATVRGVACVDLRGAAELGPA
jgi:hypothetical protein